jgi:hypothetical protein
LRFEDTLTSEQKIDEALIRINSIIIRKKMNDQLPIIETKDLIKMFYEYDNNTIHKAYDIYKSRHPETEALERESRYSRRDFDLEKTAA